MNHQDLQAAAHEEMLGNGFHPDFPPQIQTQIASIRAAAPAVPGPAVKDLRSLLWSSIDNDTSRDLDQIEYAERQPDGTTRVLIGIADVDGSVQKGSPIDLHAAAECVSVYTGVETFPMLPEELSTGLTSLNENVDRASVVIEISVTADGIVQSGQAYRALVRNRAQLTYSGVGPWLENGSAPPKVAASADLQQQLKLQDDVAQRMRAARFTSGALSIDSIETTPSIANGQVTGLQMMLKNRATELIEDFMIGANEVIARLLSSRNVASIRRVVKTPERWPRIVELAAALGEKLPEAPDSAALNNFLMKRKAADPVHAPDLSLSIVKLMGPGEYVVERPGDPPQGHFGLAVHDYTHATAPNRRFADLVTQRLIKAGAAAYGAAELDVIARNCTLREDAARKVERMMKKRIAAVVLSNRIGEVFNGVVTGVTPKGTFVRILNPPAEGRVVRGEQGLDVGDQVQVKLLETDAQRGFIDFGRTS
jgi:exoribonuclease-2